MYTVSRENGRISIADWRGKTIYSAPEDSYVVYRQVGSALTTAKIKQLTDDQLLTALANSVKLPIE